MWRFVYFLWGVSRGPLLQYEKVHKIGVFGGKWQKISAFHSNNSEWRKKFVFNYASFALSFKKNEVSGNENSIFGFLHRPLILNNWSMSPLSVYCFGRLNSSNLERSREREMQPICVPSRLPFAGPGSRARVGPLHFQCWVNHQQVSR